VERQSDIFSFGSSPQNQDGASGSGATDSGQSELQNESGPVPVLRKISFKPVSGFGLFASSTTILRYVDKESGHIFETLSDDLKTTRITNTTIPGVFDSLWINEGSVVLRYLDDENDIQSFSAEIILGDNEENSLVGDFFEKNIGQMVILGESIFTLIDVGGGSSGIVSTPDLKKRSQVLETPLKEILIFSTNKNTISINTKPSYLVFGHLFLLNTPTSSFKNLLSDIKGLTSLVSPNLKNVLYSQSESRGVSLWLFNTESLEKTKLSFSTLPEKCVWSKNSSEMVYCGIPKNISFRELPDEWYKGGLSFSDEIWKINTETGERELLGDPQELVGEEIDLITLKLNDDDSYLVFVNKKDSNLWGLLLKN